MMRIFQTLFRRPVLAGCSFCGYNCLNGYKIAQTEAAAKKKLEAEQQLEIQEKEAKRAEEEQRKRFEANKHNFLEAIERNPRDSQSYSTLGDFLLEESGFDRELHAIDPDRIDYFDKYSDWLEWSAFTIFDEFRDQDSPEDESLDDEDARNARAKQDFIDRLLARDLS